MLKCRIYKDRPEYVCFYFIFKKYLYGCDTDFVVPQPGIEPKPLAVSVES